MTQDISFALYGDLTIDDVVRWLESLNYVVVIGRLDAGVVTLSFRPKTDDGK